MKSLIGFVPLPVNLYVLLQEYDCVQYRTLPQALRGLSHNVGYIICYFSKIPNFLILKHSAEERPGDQSYSHQPRLAVRISTMILMKN